MLPGFSRSSRENLAGWLEEYEEEDQFKRDNYENRDMLKFKASVHSLLHNDNLNRIQKCLDLEKQKALYCNELIAAVERHGNEIGEKIDNRFK